MDTVAGDTYRPAPELIGRLVSGGPRVGQMAGSYRESRKQNVGKDSLAVHFKLGKTTAHLLC